jgi:hypothetical protein
MALEGGSIMRLWNTLHKLYQEKLADLRSARNKGTRRAERTRIRLEVEALDQRLVPSSIPNLSGLTMSCTTNGAGNPFCTLTFQSVQDHGGGNGTFTGYYLDSKDGASTPVSGTIMFFASEPINGLTWYDFNVVFSGTATSNYSHFLGDWSEDLSSVSGEASFWTPAIDGNAGEYNNIVPWSFEGGATDSFSLVTGRGPNTLSSTVLDSYNGGLFAGSNGMPS